MNGEGGRLGSLAERVTGHQRPRSREVPLSYAPHHRPNCRDLDFRFPGSGHGEVRLVRDGRPVGLGGMGLLRDVKDVPPLPLLRTPLDSAPRLLPPLSPSAETGLKRSMILQAVRRVRSFWGDGSSQSRRPPQACLWVQGNDGPSRQPFNGGG